MLVHARTLLTAALLWASPAIAQPLSASERAAVDSGRQVVRTETVPNTSWPRVTVFQFIAASPIEAAAVFADYERHRLFLPNVKRSHISRVIDAATVEVDYVIGVPIVADESYTVRNHVTGDNDAQTFRIAWTLVRASSTKAADGEATFEPYRDGALLTYRNLVVPGSSLAGMGFIRTRAQNEVEATARAIAEQTTKQRMRDRALLDRQVSTVQSILK